MKLFMITDADYQTEQLRQLEQTVGGYFEKRGFEAETRRVGQGELAFCIGCFGCWVKKPGECVVGDKIVQINRTAMESDVVVYLSPVIFGQFSANIKTVIDRWLPNMLPFFLTRPDGSTAHAARYEDYPSRS